MDEVDEGPPSRPQPRITVVACVKEDRRLLRLLDALTRQTLDAEAIQVVVVSAGSEQYGDECEASPLWVDHVHSPIARHAVQRNIGLDLVAADLFASTDADCVPHPRWLEDIVEEFDARPGTHVGVGGRICKYATSTLTQRYGITIDDGQRSLSVLPAMPLPYVTGANAAYRTAAVRDVGGYDETFFCGEDVDLSYRLQLRGGSLSVIHGAVIDHEDRATLREHFHRFRFYAVDQALLFKRYRGGSDRRVCICRYPWHRLGEAIGHIRNAALGSAPGRRASLSLAVATIVEAAGILVGNSQGAMGHRVLYF
jgi:cellulose synthase/poly-beta-1,6-N-acetylglucosamine synthase-like glycosyltransferase